MAEDEGEKNNKQLPSEFIAALGLGPVEPNVDGSVVIPKPGPEEKEYIRQGLFRALDRIEKIADRGELLAIQTEVPRNIENNTQQWKLVIDGYRQAEEMRYRREAEEAKNDGVPRIVNNNLFLNSEETFAMVKQRIKDGIQGKREPPGE